MSHSEAATLIPSLIDWATPRGIGYLVLKLKRDFMPIKKIELTVFISFVRAALLRPRPVWYT
jgi:hypothetical protein